jgi:eukaryotic-like serine/threonine-protein kinase
MVEGTRLLDRYRLERRLAAGGMGTVYEAHDERLNRRVAVKLLKDELASDPRFVERFRREARAVASLAHPSIADVYDYGEDEGTHFIVMQFAEGEDLALVLRREAPLVPERASRIAEGVCAALAHAHAAGIVHRDVKPANVIVGDDDRVLVTDFGIARAVGDSTLTATGSILGSTHYLSPEQAGGREIGPASDIYSLGIVLYEMLTGAVPFTADTPIAIAMRHVSDPVPAPRSLNPSVPAVYDEIVARATAKVPENRYASATEFEQALVRARAGAPASAAPTAVVGGDTQVLEGETAAAAAPAAAWTPQRAARGVAVAFAAVALLIVALLLWRALAAGDPEMETRRPAVQDEEPAETPTPTPEEREPTTFTILDSIVGMRYKEAEKQLRDVGLVVSRVDQESDAAKDTVIGSEPPPGATVEAGDEITLFVSTGTVPSEEEDEEEDRGKGKPGHVPPGQEKKEEDD